jgi:hypothetical protein
MATLVLYPSNLYLQNLCLIDELFTAIKRNNNSNYNRSVLTVDLGNRKEGFTNSGLVTFCVFCYFMTYWYPHWLYDCLQMGFQPGRGLGKDLQGIAAPVEAHLRKGRGAIGMCEPKQYTLKSSVS